MNIIKTLMSPLKVVLLTVGLLIGSSTTFAQIDNLRHGKLQNGLTYYIISDESFTDEVNFYLYQNVGSIVENDEEQGLAHFLEHMAFNATEHFPDGVMAYLRTNGLRSFNATTGLNDTQYSIYNIPADNADMINSSMLILRDWCDGILIRPEDVEKERNIIIEEWRGHRNVGKRLSEAIAEPIYNYSRYSYRNTIGTEEGIKSITTEDVQDFYDSWYRPDLQCVVIVGDINIDEYEKDVKELFSTIPKPTTPNRRENLQIEDNIEPIYYRFIDKENVSNSLGIYQRISQDMFNSKFNQSQQQLFVMLFNQLLSRRLAMFRNDGAEGYVAASADYSPLVRLYAQSAWDVVPYEGQELKALEEILSIRESIRRNGFQEDEFLEVQEDLYSEIKSVLEEENLGVPDNYMSIFKQNYLYDVPIISFEERMANLAGEMLEMEVDDLNEWKDMWMDDKNISFITYSNAEDEMNVSLETFNKMLAESKTAPIAEAKKFQPIEELIDFEIEKGEIVSDNLISELDVDEWILSNGARVLYKHLPDMGEEMFFVGSALGGRSLVENKDLPSYKAMEALIMQSGLYKYNRNQLHNWNRGKDFDLSLNITDYTDGIGGRASTKHSEDFFKYLYLVLSKQSFDENVFDKYVQKKKFVYNNKSTEGMAAVEDSIRALLYPYSASNPKEDMDFINQMNYAEMNRLYDDRYGDASQFTFCLITSIAKEESKELIEKYIASLPGNPNSPKRTYKVADNSSPEKEIIHEFIVDINNNVGEVEIAYSNAKKLSAKDQKALPLVEQILQNKLFDELREKEGGVYSISVRTNYESIPVPNAALNIHFSTESSKVDNLKKMTYDIIDDVAEGNFSEDEFNNVYIPTVLAEEMENDMSGGEETDEENSSNPFFWIAVLNAYAEEGDVPDNETEEVSARSITQEDVATSLRNLLENAKHRDIVVRSLPIEDREWKVKDIE